MAEKTDLFVYSMFVTLNTCWAGIATTIKMAVKMRLRRMGKKKQPLYRVVVADARCPRDGRFIETLGQYNPRTSPSTVNLKEEEALGWLLKGAQPTDTVKGLLKKTGVWDKFLEARDTEKK